MLAIDTNVVVRYLVKDDAQQTEKAKNLIESQNVFISLTVVLETEWVLRNVYEFPRERIFDSLRAFAGLSRVEVEESYRLQTALDWAANGLDFADALHLASADHCEAFVTFDKAFVKAAKARTSRNVRQLLI